ncbi:Acyl-CoA dehydrogenase/oxidase, N-terminal and middle domain containing protein [Russula decolorans]
MSKEFKELMREEHNENGDLWVIIDVNVYDISRFADLHPGGRRSVLVDSAIAGQDATEAFCGLHRHEVLERPQYARLQIGVLRGEQSVITGRLIGGLSSVPFAEPTYLTEGFHSPYYTEEVFDEVVYPDAQERELDGKRHSQEVFDKMAEVNLNAMRLGPGKHLKGLSLFHGLVKPEEFDYFHELIITQEMIRTGSRGYADRDGYWLATVPPVLNFGSPEIKAKIVPEVFATKKFICLAISEARAGSDVLGMKTTAVKSEDGKFWIINGEKKWITNGQYVNISRRPVIRDDETVTVQLRRLDGLTVILIPRQEGVTTKPIKTSYSPTAGTAYVTFDNVRVPVENTLGPEGGGIFVIPSNFYHERWVMVCASARAQRMIVEECLKWVSQRKAFGKPLSSQAVVRAKLAAIIARAEAVQAWLENVTYQMCNMSYEDQATNLAGQIAFLKMYSTRCAQDTARDAVQIFGGRGITQTGMGRFIKHYYRTVPFDSILGGAEDVLGDLGVRQAIHAMPKNARL